MFGRTKMLIYIGDWDGYCRPGSGYSTCEQPDSRDSGSDKQTHRLLWIERNTDRTHLEDFWGSCRKKRWESVDWYCLHPCEVQHHDTCMLTTAAFGINSPPSTLSLSCIDDKWLTGMCVWKRDCEPPARSARLLQNIKQQWVSWVNMQQAWGERVITQQINDREWVQGWKGHVLEFLASTLPSFDPRTLWGEH